VALPPESVMAHRCWCDGSISTGAAMLHPASADAQPASPAALTARVAAQSAVVAVMTVSQSTPPAASSIDKMTKTIGAVELRPPRVPK
jgi:hypothetical protein